MTGRDELAFFSSPGPLTRISAPELTELPKLDHLGVVGLARGLAIHEQNAGLYGVQQAEDQRGLEHLRPAEALLERVRELDDAPLTTCRSPERRLITYCRNLAVLTTALMRAVSVPARVRGGFSPDDRPNAYGVRYSDHWWVQAWNAAQGRWVMMDPSLDARVMDLDYDPDDLPPGRCISAAEAWVRCRRGEDDADTFGVQDLRGPWFVRSNVVGDLATLNKIELLPWDSWGLMDAVRPLADPRVGHGPNDELLDTVADAIAADDWARIRTLYLDNDQLRPPAALINSRMGSYPSYAP